MHKEIPTLTIKQLLSNGDKYAIPVYQRNYAWGEPEITQLIQDIIDSITEKNTDSYYLGTLVVSEESKDNKIIFNTIDGQQRLTTLSILTAAIKNTYKTEVDLSWFDELTLSFASREKSTLTLQSVFNGVFDRNKENYNLSVTDAYNICIYVLKEKIGESKISIEKFVEYLYQNIKILRVSLPKDTDLNHYFEIMNSRGEQLEKHEILKAELMSVFNVLDTPIANSYKEGFDLIWEACANMEKYVQYGFTTTQRDSIFGKTNWDTLQVHDFDTYINKLFPNYSGEVRKNGKDITAILDSPLSEIINEDTDDSPDRFNSVLNFQNFLIHVLRVQTRNREIALDDKRLLIFFDAELEKNKENKIGFVKEFIFNLLRCKHLIDKYVIKREFLGNNDRWSLKKLKWYPQNRVSYVNTFGEEHNDSSESENRIIIMLLSMFHVSTPTMVYKHWFNAALFYLFYQQDINPKEYAKYLEHIAKAFVFDKHLSENGKDYFDIIYIGDINHDREEKNIKFCKLNYGSIENNLIFNFLDYLLWTKYKIAHKEVREYEFTFRSSVEHFYPQIPIGGDRISDEADLHSFGNLCLISHNKNSKLSNHLPSAKLDFYRKGNIDSVKQFLMMNLLKEKGSWNVDEIRSHAKEMTAIFTENIDSKYIPNNHISIAKRWFNEYKISNKTLLARTLLCFGDIACDNGSILGNEKYNFYEWDYIEKTTMYNDFIEYVDKNNPKSLQEIIDFKLKEGNIEKSDYRDIFIKYPILMEYCENGNFGWLNDGAKIIILQGFKISDYKSKEVYVYLLENYLREIGISVFSNYQGIFFCLKYEDGRFSITEDYDGRDAFFKIWNDNGETMNYSLESHLHGNSNLYKELYELKWIKNENGYFIRNDNGVLITLGVNYEDNFFSLRKAFIELFRNNLNIDL